MWSGVSVSTKPGGELISIAKLKSRLRIDVADDDEMLGDMLKGAIARIDGPNGIGVAMLKQTWRKSMDCFPSCIMLPGAPIKGVTSITYVNNDGVTQTLAADKYRVDLNKEPVRVEPAYGLSWPSSRDVIGAVTVEYEVGENSAADVHADLIDAVCLIVGHRYANREAVSEDAAHALPLGVEWILQEHVRCHVTA
ncbi:putative phiE125 gp8 family phage protein [Sinorhizobium terangae]|uniref:Phage gp6-like head-tail connector protein n=1 Tax=Sinorhizobium terangae TaxID=110322 RepID=A0A6N7LP12_SINTE|nr:head-tail connector protein [Sinorhizobium terangae]MBB4185829.1 putative phiE125 gp8 family phage protein [Sinorhizobium terangae]MQX19376.1 hypothetical protein [Sinorhizobium terangae]